MKKILFFLAMLPMLVFTACSDDDENSLSLDKSGISLYFKDEIKLTASDNVTWSSEDDFVAGVSSSGVVEGRHVGKTFIVASNGAETVKCAVEVKPKYNTFVEPVLDFGSSKADIKVKEKRELRTDNATSLVYMDNKDGVGVVYTFEDGKMKSCGLVLLQYKYAEDIMDFLLERYAPYTMDDDGDMFIFVNGMPDKWDMIVSLSVETNGIVVLYAPKDAIISKSVSDEVPDIMEHARSILKYSKSIN
ncbi:Ig-like domain-containing protein [Barnesiella intestinihominis]|uniref:Ig-like domain-containing protein n=1 Tax=Barnesiella intestinihominis TaxID=487174 RepID=UPI003AB3BE41